jgi:hypothetical protein
MSPPSSKTKPSNQSLERIGEKTLPMELTSGRLSPVLILPGHPFASPRVQLNRYADT